MPAPESVPSSVNNGPVFMNEGDNAYMQSFAQNNNTGIPVELVNLPLKAEKEGQESAIDRFINGNYSAWVTGIDSTTADVASACRNVIGLDQDKLLSSIFSMEKADEKTIYLGDCAIVPSPTADQLIKIAGKTVETLGDFGEIPKIAFLKSAGQPDLAKGDVVGRAAEVFRQTHPYVETIGTTTWKQAREQGANTFIFPGLDAGNIGYKILNDPDGGGWQAKGNLGSRLKTLEKNGRKRYLSSPSMHTPTAEDLVEMTVDAFSVVTKDKPKDYRPKIALLSFATENSAPKAPEPKVVQEAIKLIAERYPELQIAVEGPLQWDSAVNQRIFKKKTGRPFPGEPDVFIFPTRDSAEIAYDMLQEPDVGGRVAVGPIFQGLKGGKKVIDLSRGAQEAEIAGAARIGGGKRLKVVSKGQPALNSYNSEVA